MALHAQRQGLHSLEYYECVEGGDGASGVSEKHRTDTCGKRCILGRVGEHCAVIARIGLCEGGKFLSIGLPVEGSGIDYDSAQACAMASEKLGG